MNSKKKHYFISCLLLINSFLFIFTSAKTTLNTSDLLRDNDDETLVAGNFELGFFSPDDSSDRYVGIWYKDITPRTVVWTANRDNPLTDRSGALRVIQPGLLLLLLNASNSTTTFIWSTNSSTSVQNSVATLLDSGNLVVKDANAPSFLWQSFDYPTDTFLSGMKLGKNFVTGLEVYLTSRKKAGNPASGDYTYHCDPTGYPQNERRKGGVVTYRTGPWNGRGFSGMPTLFANPMFAFEMVINEQEVYYHYSVVNSSVITMITMSETGFVQRVYWDEKAKEWGGYLSVPVDKCDIYNGCGPYGSCNIKNYPTCECLDKFKLRDPQDSSSGCVRKTALSCESGDGFLKYSGIKLPDTRTSRYNRSMSLDECKTECTKECSCTAYTSLDISRGGGGDGDGCLLWYGDLVDMREISPGQDIYIRMAKSELGSGSSRKILIVALPLVVALSLVILGLLLCHRKWKWKWKRLDKQLPETGSVRYKDLDIHQDQSLKNLELPLFDSSTIIKATDNFSHNNKLGQGGFGPVYKGRLGEEQEIAVKCLSRTSHQGVDEFKNEIICYAKLQHRNLVKLLGCCTQGEQLMLVYEYMKNRSLDLIIFDPKMSTSLEWPVRFNIINGIARGIMYLHQDSSLRVIHRDLKASNILLDSDMNPKISDFGLARTFGGNETGADTSRIVGTYGYMSPEYARDGLYSVKSDVYSFGVIVLEIVSGKRNRGFSHGDHDVSLLGYAWMLYKEERHMELGEPYFGINSCYISEVMRSIHVGLLCVQELPQDRPSMSAVVAMLGNDAVLPEPKPPGFFAGGDALRPKTSSTGSSINVVTNSQLEGR